MGQIDSKCATVSKLTKKSVLLVRQDKDSKIGSKRPIFFSLSERECVCVCVCECVRVCVSPSMTYGGCKVHAQNTNTDMDISTPHSGYSE